MKFANWCCKLRIVERPRRINFICKESIFHNEFLAARYCELYDSTALSSSSKVEKRLSTPIIRSV